MLFLFLFFVSWLLVSAVFVFGWSKHQQRMEEFDGKEKDRPQD